MTGMGQIEGIEHVCLIAPPFHDGSAWITVPPAGYGGIQWSMAHLMDGLLELGLSLTLLGAPGSSWSPDSVDVPRVSTREDIVAWLDHHRPVLVHDFANFSDLQDDMPSGTAYCRTWQLTSPPPGQGNTVFASAAQMRSVGVEGSVVIPLPVNPSRYVLTESKGDYLLFLGRISAWKGTYEAAALASFLGVRLVVAGPSWEPGYLDRILADFGDHIDLVGEVGGPRRGRLIAEARALAVLSQPVDGPWGQVWCEPGAAVVAEAAASGTPVLATDNGCLPSLMPGVGAVVSTGALFTEADRAAVAGLPEPRQIRDTAERRWSHLTIASEYLQVYRRTLASERWR